MQEYVTSPSTSILLPQLPLLPHGLESHGSVTFGPFGHMHDKLDAIMDNFELVAIVDNCALVAIVASKLVICVKSASIATRRASMTFNVPLTWPTVVSVLCTRR